MLQKIVLKYTKKLRTLNCPTDLKQHKYISTQWHLHIWGFIRGFSNVSFWITCVHQNIWEPCTRPCSSGPDLYLSKVRKELVIDCLEIPSKYKFWGCGESVRFKKTVTQISFHSKLWYFQYKSKLFIYSLHQLKPKTKTKNKNPK